MKKTKGIKLFIMTALMLVLLVSSVILPVSANASGANLLTSGDFEDIIRYTDARFDLSTTERYGIGVYAVNDSHGIIKKESDGNVYLELSYSETGKAFSSFYASMSGITEGDYNVTMDIKMGANFDRSNTSGQGNIGFRFYGAGHDSDPLADEIYSHNVNEWFTIQETYNVPTGSNVDSLQMWFNTGSSETQVLMIDNVSVVKKGEQTNHFPSIGFTDMLNDADEYFEVSSSDENETRMGIGPISGDSYPIIRKEGSNSYMELAYRENKGSFASFFAFFPSTSTIEVGERYVVSFDAKLGDNFNTTVTGDSNIGFGFYDIGKGIRWELNGLASEFYSHKKGEWFTVTKVFDVPTDAVTVDSLHFWFNTESNANQVLMLDNVTVVKAENVGITYTVANGENPNTLQTFKVGDTVNFAAPTNTTKHFIGWEINGNLYKAGKDYVIDQLNGATLEVKAVYLDINMEGASAKLKGEKGLRFGGTVNAEDYNAFNEIFGAELELGIVFAPTYVAERPNQVLSGTVEENLTIDNAGINPMVVKMSEFKSHQDTTKKLFVTVVDFTGYTELQLCKLKFSARTYATVTYADGEKVTYYSGVSQSHSIYTVSQSALLAESLTPAQTEYLQKIIDLVEGANNG